jgi:2-keto-4-pentenoate hydratase/2-oxohepta-3-ene-1,7-dioic acid hydratase in catechol pathway
VRLASVSVDGRESVAQVDVDGFHLAQNPNDTRSMLDIIIESGGQPPAPETFGSHGYEASQVELLAPLRPGKILAIGRNYPAHAEESGADVPSSPMVFAKFPSSVIGPGEPIICDRTITQAVDFEAELAVVIGRRARDVEPQDALDVVFAYTCLNDVSARDLQAADGQWVRAKSLDTFCPMGPWLTTADEVDDPQALGIRCVLNGEEMQSASTAEMYFTVRELIARLSRWFTLAPGDVIATGTPAGVGFRRNPQRLLMDGDEVSVVVDRIGELRNPVRWIGPGSGSDSKGEAS